MKLVKMKCDNCGATLDVNKDLDKIHCNYCGAEIFIDDEASSLKRIEDVKLKARKENHEQSMKERQDIHEQEMKEKRDLEELNSSDKFKKSKFSKVLLVFAVICGLLTFTNGFNFASVISIIQAFLFLGAWLIGMKIINVKVKNLSIILAVIGFALMIPYISLINSDPSYKDKPTKIDISEIELKDKLPKPNNLYGRLDTNRSDLLIIELCNLSKSEYKSYVNNQVTKAGFTIDLEYEDWDTVYGAFDSDGYSIRIIYSDKEEKMHITLKTPEKMEEFEWPTTGLGSMLPATTSTHGNISWNNSDIFIVHVGNTTINEYNDYVKECESIGFTVNYSKDKKYYYAENSEGYKLSLRYLGANVIEVSLKIEEDDETTTTTKPTTSTTTTTTTTKKNNSTNNGLRSDFKKAMDSYEAFIDEYVAFMKKYNKSNGSDISLINDLSKYITKYAEFSEAFEKWEDEDLNDAELKYYLEVEARVLKKLNEVQ